MKLIVGGCSVSDRTEVQECYGEILARRLNVEYIHHGAGCGSNYRIWRKITTDVINNNICAGDLVIVQYTEITRQEFWSSFKAHDKHRYDHYGTIKMREEYDGGDILRWKLLLKGCGPYEPTFMKLKEEHFTNTNFDIERFTYNHFLFHNTLINKGIKVVYFVPTGYMSGYGNRIIDYFKDNGEIHLKQHYGDAELQYLLPDRCHFSKLGHEHVAEKLEEQLRERELIK